MMKNKHGLLILLSILFLVVIIGFAVTEFNFTKSERLSTKEQEYVEDLSGKRNLEYLMLRDPETQQIPVEVRKNEVKYARTLPERKSYSLKNGNNIASYNWHSAGPVNIAGRTRALDYDINNENIIIAGGVSGGMFKSTDGGQTWKRTTNAGDVHSVTSVVQDRRPGKTNTWYYASGEFNGNSAKDPSGSANYYGGGVYKSIDNGDTWNLLPATNSSNTLWDSPFDFVYRIKVDNSNLTQDVVYCATPIGVVKSTDGGDNWSLAFGSSSSNDASVFTDIEITSTGKLYVANSTNSTSGNNSPIAGIYKSDDGINFKNITPDFFPSFVNRIVLDVYEANENVVYFLAFTPGFGTSHHSLWRYDDSDGSWQDLSASVPEYNGTADSVYNFDSQGAYDLTLAVKPDDENTVVIGGTVLYRSTDGFQTPDNTDFIGGYDFDNNPLPLYENHWVDQHVIKFSEDDPNKMFVGNDGGVYITDNITADKVVWSPTANGYVTSQFYNVAIDENKSGDQFIIGGLQDRGVWFDYSFSPNNPWDVINVPGDGGYCDVQENGEYALISYQNGATIKVKKNDPNNFTSINDVLIVQPDENLFEFVNPFRIDPNDNETVYVASSQGIYRIDNISSVGSNVPANLEIIPNTNVDEKIYGLDVSTDAQHILYYGTETGRIVRVENANTNNPTVTEVTDPSFPNGFISAVKVDPKNSDNVLIVFSNYNVISLFASKDGGNSWEAIAGNLEQNPDGSGNGPSVRDVDVIYSSGSPIYFAATSAGLYSATSLDGMNTVWENEGTNTIGNIVVSSLQTRQSDGTVIAASHGAGVYATTVITYVEDNNNLSPDNFVLEQNYPNPFNPTTKIEYSVQSDENVGLKVYDILGNEVAELVNEQKSAGTYKVIFDADKYGLASGTYIYKLVVGNVNESKKMILLK